MKLELIKILFDNFDTVDIDDEFDRYLNETYSFGDVGGPYVYLIPSTVLKKCSPVDYDCYQVDWLDEQDYIEYEGYHWKKADYEEALEIYEEQEDEE